MWHWIDMRGNSQVGWIFPYEPSNHFAWLPFSREQQHLNTSVLQRTPVVERITSFPFVTGPQPANIQGYLRAGKPNIGWSSETTLQTIPPSPCWFSFTNVKPCVINNQINKKWVGKIGNSKYMFCLWVTACADLHFRICLSWFFCMLVLIQVSQLGSRDNLLFYPCQFCSHTFAVELKYW